MDPTSDYQLLPPTTYQPLRPSPPPGQRDKRRWGGIFSADGLQSPSSWRPSTKYRAPLVDVHQSEGCDDMDTTPDAPVATKTPHRASLVRSNAVSSRRSLPPSFVEDTHPSRLFEDIDILLGTAREAYSADDGPAGVSSPPIAEGGGLLDTAKRRVDALERENKMLREGLLEMAASNGTSTPERQELAALRLQKDKLKKEVEALGMSGARNSDLLHPLVQDFQESYRSNDKKGHTLAAFRRYLTKLTQSHTLVSSLEDSLTPRGIMLLKLQQLPPEGSQGRGDARNGMDTPLDLDRATKFSRSLDTDLRSSLTKIEVKQCSVCRKLKFLNAPLPSSSSSTGLSEFNPEFGITSCCSKPICTSCLLNAVASGISTDLWSNITSSQWLRCPIQGCWRTLPIRNSSEMAGFLSSIGDSLIWEHMMQFHLATELRDVLKSVRPLPSPAALAKAADLHSQLWKHGRMHGLFEFTDMGDLGLDVLPIEDGEGTLQVPILTGLLGRRVQSPKRQLVLTLARECVVCTESIPDVVDGTAIDEERWAEATAAFPGDWQRQVRAFPAPSLVPECGQRHRMEICRGCLSRHLESQLEALGRAGCDRLSCPAPDCGHVYTHGEVGLLASAETFARVDRFRRLRHLTSQPNFRWCLGVGCQAGHVYELPAEDGQDAGDGKRIECGTCGFAMCFEHQTPWHEGISCAAFDKTLGDADLDAAATRAWIAANTKACPGQDCGAPVEKRGGCFHMTCGACRSEFCWECLAPWSRIARRGFTGRRYNREGHHVGCYFRGKKAVGPMMLVGETVEDGLARL